MLNAKELRLGNNIQLTIDTGEGKQIDILEVQEIKIDDSMIGCWSTIMDSPEWFDLETEDIKPIPLTEQWLIDLGFTSNPYDDTYENETLEINCDKTKGFTELWIDKYPHIKYVHQLQNLYFALTGKELTQPS